VNFYAEMMLRETGVVTSGHGTAAAGSAAERTLAHAWDLPFGTAYDGSGLSYRDREAPATIQAWLSKFASVPNFSHEYYALPASCRIGTLEHRMCGPHVAGLVRAKTGTLNHVSALSGYVTAESGHHIVFSILASGFSDKKYQQIYNHVDAAVVALRRKG
jgi:D-alanyl-D-alanine carboxypeptidase/D-alanyl-D-alanine-endopeptidase (penicillin-binding protein 4)